MDFKVSQVWEEEKRKWRDFSGLLFLLTLHERERADWNEVSATLNDKRLILYMFTFCIKAFCYSWLSAIVILNVSPNGIIQVEYKYELIRKLQPPYNIISFNLSINQISNLSSF